MKEFGWWGKEILYNPPEEVNGMKFWYYGVRWVNIQFKVYPDVIFISASPEASRNRGIMEIVFKSGDDCGIKVFDLETQELKALYSFKNNKLLSDAVSAFARG